MGNRYEIIEQVRGAHGLGRVYVGNKGRCRFCERGSDASFRKIAHTFPEALGNKWVFSLDECDDCNEKFSRYEGALAESVAPLLTLGGVSGKGNRVRQVGRSAGPKILTHSVGSAGRHISTQIKGYDISGLVNFDSITGRPRFKIPIAAVPFRPRDAYKALCKMAVALLPETELGHYTKLLAWLQDPNDLVDFPVLEVGFSMGYVGNAPPVVVGTLMKRCNPSDMVPNIIFVLSAGSVCFQIDLMSDSLENHIPPIPTGALNINWKNTISDGQGRSITIDYGVPIHFNWTSQETEPQPIDLVTLEFDPITTEGCFIPSLRAQQHR